MTDKFHFGKNWQEYLDKHFSHDALSASKKELSAFLRVSLEGKTFVDVGCGSGAHSLAALELGASKVVSVDSDEDSVICARQLKEKFHKSNWEIQGGSLLDLEFIKSLGTGDIVYCWGVAHHTGDMWQALDNLAYLVKPEGLLFVAIYNYVEGRRGSKMWFQVKKTYNRSPWLIKKALEGLYISWNFLALILHLKNPFKAISNYKRKRGMAWSTDMVDWLGGYPYEYASTEEIFNFYNKKGFELQNIKTTNYIGCNQFLFRKK
jgi:SAM-dependent methyltransferase